MTPSLRTAHACRAACALLLASAACAAAWHPWLAAAGLGAAAVFAHRAARAGTEHRRRVALARQAELLARPAGPVPVAAPRPCCAFWLLGDGRAHAEECAGARHRPAPSRRQPALPSGSSGRMKVRS
ncbi:hypothetical protein [Streptomyces sp. NPDC003717]|uniref:hypothetical protein n=1 Tax=Streptomyces sp. NPDC003717 TaxID=3154276 RepID=UPI0033B05A41